MTVGEWCANYRREHHDATLTDCIRAMRASGEYEQCRRESAAKAPKQRRREQRQQPQRTANQIIQAGLAELNRSYTRMIGRG